MMKTRHLVALLAAVGAAGAGATSANADVLEIGANPFAPLVAPTCPVGVSAANCTIILTQVTAMETLRAGVSYPTTVKKPGYIVAVTLGLSRLNTDPKQAASAVSFLNTSYGGAPAAAVTVLKPVHNPRLRDWKVAAESSPIKLQPYLGEVAQFPLSTPLKVKPPEVIAITVPTWAPILTFDLSSKQYAYRQSRTGELQPTPEHEQGSAGRQCPERRLRVRLPGHPRRVHRHRGDLAAARLHDEDDEDDQGHPVDDHHHDVRQELRSGEDDRPGRGDQEDDDDQDVVDGHLYATQLAG